MTDRAHVDIESFSECDLKSAGLYRYAEHPTTDLHVLCYTFNEGPVHVWVPREAIPDAVIAGIRARMDKGAVLYVQIKVPDDLREWIEAGKQVRAHNAQFERTVLNGVAGQKLGFPKLKIGQMVCTAAKAAAAALPRDLDSAAKARGTYPKKAVGKNDMLACAKPRNKESEPRWTPENDPDRFIRLYDYCIDDVKAERDLDANTPDLSENEQAVWEMDQRINDRGVAVDLEAIASIKTLITARKEELAARCKEITGASPTQTMVIADWIRGNGYPQLPNLQADTVNRAQLDPDCPPLVREMLLIYSAYNMKAVSKYDAILRSVCADGRIRGMFLYYGANTGRWSSLIVQLQNLYRPVIKDCDAAIDAMAMRDLGWIKFLYPNTEPMKVFASCIRGMFVAGSGKKFISLDYSGIESRFTARMFAEWWKVKAFELFDKGEGPDSYRLAYARAFQIHVDKVDQHMRQIGKVLELACLGEDTLVLTHNGAKRIVDVDLTDLLWDGKTWIKHQGLVDRGVRQVVNVAGIEATPDHLMLTGQTWRPAAELVSNENTLRLALARGSENLPWLNTASDRLEGSPRLFGLNAIAALRVIRSTITTYVKAHQPLALNALVKKPVITRKSTGAMPTSCQMTSTGEGCSTESRLASVDARTRGPEDTKITGVEEYEFIRSGRKTDERFCDIFSRWMDGITQNWTWIVSTLMGTTNRGTYGSLLEKKTATTDAPLLNSKSESANWRPVYDLKNAGPLNRFTILSDRGPLIAHNCGFEGGVGAFCTAAGTYGVDLDALTEAVWYTIPADVMDKSEWMWDKFGKGSGLDKRAYLGLNSLKEMWRIAHPRHVQGWRDMKDAAIAAIENPGKAYSIPSKWIMFKVEEDWLLMRLPSGRRIRYYKPEVEYDYIDCGENCEGGTCKACAGTGKIRNPRSARITYLGIDTDTRRWMRTGTYGGKLTENGAQGGSSDLLRHGVMALEREKYWPVMTVHDEVVCEVDLEFGSLKEATRVFVDKPVWAEGLPIAAEGWSGKRYRKE